LDFHWSTTLYTVALQKLKKRQNKTNETVLREAMRSSPINSWTAVIGSQQNFEGKSVSEVWFGEVTKCELKRYTDGSDYPAITLRVLAERGELLDSRGKYLASDPDAYVKGKGATCNVTVWQTELLEPFTFADFFKKTKSKHQWNLTTKGRKYRSYHLERRLLEDKEEAGDYDDLDADGAHHLMTEVLEEGERDNFKDHVDNDYVSSSSSSSSTSHGKNNKKRKTQK
jgi:hypothetical protein